MGAAWSQFRLATTSSSSEDILEKELTRLKNLFDKGLITQPVYESRQKELLSGSSAPTTAPTDLALINKFKELVEKERKDVDVRQAIFEIIVERFYDALVRANYLGSHSMLNLFDLIKDAPNSSTKQRLISKSNIRIHEPVSTFKPNVFRAVDAKGIPVMLKFITEKEEKIIKLLSDCKPPITGLLLGYTVHQESPKVVERIALIMPRLLNDVAQEPSVYPSVLLLQGMRIKKALERMHELGLVHLDVKLENIFVNSEGLWFLSDFDFTCKANELIPEFHNSFYPITKRKHIAVPQFDLYLLGVHLVIQLCCRDDLTKIKGNIGVDVKKVRDVLTQFNHEDPKTDELKSFILELLDKYYIKCPGTCKQCDQLYLES